MGRGRFVFRLITGGYLAWLGFDLVRSALTEKPENYVWYTMAGAAFLIIGLGWLLTGIRSYQKEQALEAEVAQQEEQQEQQDDVQDEATDCREVKEIETEIETEKTGKNSEETDEEE